MVTCRCLASNMFTIFTILVSVLACYLLLIATKPSFSLCIQLRLMWMSLVWQVFQKVLDKLKFWWVGIECLPQISWQSFQLLLRHFSQNYKCQPAGSARVLRKLRKSLEFMGTMSVCTKFHGNPSNSCWNKLSTSAISLRLQKYYLGPETKISPAVFHFSTVSMSWYNDQTVNVITTGEINE